MAEVQQALTFIAVGASLPINYHIPLNDNPIYLTAKATAQMMFFGQMLVPTLGYLGQPFFGDVTWINADLLTTQKLKDPQFFPKLNKVSCFFAGAVFSTIEYYILNCARSNFERALTITHLCYNETLGQHHAQSYDLPTVSLQ